VGVVPLPPLTAGRPPPRAVGSLVTGAGEVDGLGSTTSRDDGAGGGADGAGSRGISTIATGERGAGTISGRGSAVGGGVASIAGAGEGAEAAGALGAGEVGRDRKRFD